LERSGRNHRHELLDLHPGDAATAVEPRLRGQRFDCAWGGLMQAEMSTAAAELPTGLAADDRVDVYEMAQLAAKAWPPTRWFADSVSGLDLIDAARPNCPIAMRRLGYQKAA
jgi:hypothetical protein